MESMGQVEIHILMQIMEEILEDLYNKEKENSKLDHFHHKENTQINLIMFKVNHFIILEMVQVETVILCTFIIYS